MKSHHLEGARLHARRTSVTATWLQEDGSRGIIPTQGLSGTGGHARRASAETTDVGLIYSQRFVLGHLDASGGCAKAPVMPGNAGHLTCPAAAAHVWANVDPFSHVVHGRAPTVAPSRETDADASTQRRPSSASRARLQCGRPSQVGQQDRFLLHPVIQQIACRGKVIGALLSHDADWRVLLPADYDESVGRSRGPGQHVGFWLQDG